MFLFTLLMISREGMETALLMGTLLFQVRALDIILGAVAGIAVAGVVAWLWSRYGHRVNLGLFFQVTAIFLLIFVVQLLIYGFHELTEANICSPAARRCTGRPSRTAPTASTASTSPTCSSPVRSAGCCSRC